MSQAFAIRPCPFCGHREIANQGCRMQCQACYATGPMIDAAPRETQRQQHARAADAWNRRCVQPESEMPALPGAAPALFAVVQAYVRCYEAEQHEALAMDRLYRQALLALTQVTGEDYG